MTYTATKYKVFHDANVYKVGLYSVTCTPNKLMKCDERAETTTDIWLISVPKPDVTTIYYPYVGRGGTLF